MDVDTYYRAHAAIVSEITKLRKLSGNGVENNATDIAKTISAMKGRIKHHLESEDKVLYPKLANCDNAELATLGKQYQNEMAGLAEAFEEFSNKWTVADNLSTNPEGFKHDANIVLKGLFERIHRENKELYPAAKQFINATDTVH